VLFRSINSKLPYQFPRGKTVLSSPQTITNYQSFVYVLIVFVFDILSASVGKLFRTIKRALSINIEALSINIEALLINIEALSINIEALLINIEALLINVEALLINIEALSINIEALSANIGARLINKKYFQPFFFTKTPCL